MLEPKKGLITKIGKNRDLTQVGNRRTKLKEVAIMGNEQVHWTMVS